MAEVSSGSAHVDFMRLALAQAEEAARSGEVPVGAVVVAADGRTILGKGHNRCIQGHDPTAHAEIQAMREAAQALGNYRLEGCSLYVTLEPCAMCSGAMLHARLAHVVYAVPDPRTGAAGSVLDLFVPSDINHHTRAHRLGGEGEAVAVSHQCAEVLTRFFRERRQQHAQQRVQAEKAPLREDALRPTAGALAAEDVWQLHSRWTMVPDPRDHSAVAWRMHALDTGAAQAAEAEQASKPSHELEIGHKPCVVLLHGYAGSAAVWQEVAIAVSQAGWRVLAPDLPGHGLSDKPRQPALHTLQWHRGMLQSWLDRQALPRKWLLVTLDSAALLVPETFPADRVLALEHVDAPVQWPDATSATVNPKDWRLRCLRSPRFDLSQHWSADDLPALAGMLQASYPDAGHRCALRWSTFAGQGASDVDHQWWLAYGRRIPLIRLEQTPVKADHPGGRIRAALRHNIPLVLQWLEQHRAATPSS